MKSNQFLSVPPSSGLLTPSSYENLVIMKYPSHFLPGREAREEGPLGSHNPFPSNVSGIVEKKQEHSRSRDSKGGLAVITRTSHAVTPNCLHYISTLILTPYLKFSKSKSISIPSLPQNRALPWFLYFSNGIIHHFASGQGLIL